MKQRCEAEGRSLKAGPCDDEGRLQGQSQCELDPVTQATLLLTNTSKWNFFKNGCSRGCFCAETDLLGILWHHLVGQMDWEYLGWQWGECICGNSVSQHVRDRGVSITWRYPPCALGCTAQTHLTDKKQSEIRNGFWKKPMPTGWAHGKSSNFSWSS